MEEEVGLTLTPDNETHLERLISRIAFPSVITLSCGFSVEFLTNAEFPRYSLHCGCGNPYHWYIVILRHR